jgi:D-alanyl-D-alanine carboxypeptidase/D-alanyl-D-alanine-endopeptidase (penicillin-binding protein 4)
MRFGRSVSRSMLMLVVLLAAVITGILVAAAALIDTRSPSTSVPRSLPGLATDGTALSQLPTGVAPSRVGLARALDPQLEDPALGPAPEAAVVDLTTGRLLYAQRATVPTLPASNAKLATAVAALRALGPDAVLRTRAVLHRRAGSPTLLLVGGGDPTLTALRTPADGYPRPASLNDLARATARALRRDGVRRISVAVDDGLFAGPTTGPGWKPTYVGEGDVAPVSALEVDGGRIDPQHKDHPGNRYADPAVAAGERFADLLARLGIKVTGDVTRRTTSPADRPLAGVASPPVSALVAGMLQRSDNDLAEALARHVALADGQPASYAGAAAALAHVLRQAHVPPGAVRLVDGSGLSRLDRVTPLGLIALLRLTQSPDLASLAADLPVAGFTGTLADRFRGPRPRSRPRTGAGIVRAKTGTLTGTSALSGITTTADGRLLGFAVLAPRVSSTGTLRAQAALDRVAATLTRCGCR